MHINIHVSINNNLRTRCRIMPSFGGISLPHTCKIDYVNMQDNYVNMQDNYVFMQDNYMSTCKIIMLACKLQIFIESLILIGVKWLTNAGLGQHRCKMQHIYDNTRLMYIDTRHNYVDMRHIYVNKRVYYVYMQDIFVEMRVNYVGMRL